MHYFIKDFLLTVLLRSVSYKDLLLQIKWGQSKQYFQIFVSYSSKIASNQEGFFSSKMKSEKYVWNFVSAPPTKTTILIDIGLVEYLKTKRVYF